MTPSKKFRESLMLIVVGILLYFLLTNYKLFFSILFYVYDILFPVLLGGLIAFILNVPMSAIEKKFFKPPKNPKRQKLVESIKRPCSIALTLLVAVGVIVLLLVLIIPSIAKTISSLSENVPTIVDHISETIENNKALSSLFKNLDITKDSIVNGLTDWLKGGISAVKTMDSTVSLATSIFSSIVNFVLGTIFAIYFLAQKEKLKRQATKFCSAFFPDKSTNRFSRIAQRSVDTFGKFLSGQCLDAVLLGSLTALGTTLLGFPDGLLIGVVIAVAALIPIVGSCVGMGVGFLLICVHSFSQAIWFVVFLLVLIQIDCNFVYPRIVGNSVGLPSLWVLFAVTVGGRAFGVLGMFISVPICAVIYSALSEIVDNRIKNRDIYRKLREERRARRAARFSGVDVSNKQAEQAGQTEQTEQAGQSTNVPPEDKDSSAQPDNSVSPDNTTDGADDANPSEPAT